MDTCSASIAEIEHDYQNSLNEIEWRLNDCKAYVADYKKFIASLNANVDCSPAHRIRTYCLRDALSAIPADNPGWNTVFEGETLGELFDSGSKVEELHANGKIPTFSVEIKWQVQLLANTIYNNLDF